MEAPKKVYRTTTYLDSDRGKTVWKNKPVPGAENVEYIRTDAFIEKACELLARMIWEVTYEDLEGNSVQHYDKMEFIKDFCKAMKGE